jgi:hypothetical protein
MAVLCESRAEYRGERAEVLSLRTLSMVIISRIQAVS